MAAELAGRDLAWVHASWALRLNESKKRSAKRNSADQIQRPRRTGGIVSGPGRTARAKPRAMQSRPTTKTPTRYAWPTPGLERTRSRHPPLGTSAGSPRPSSDTDVWRRWRVSKAVSVDDILDGYPRT